MDKFNDFSALKALKKELEEREAVVMQKEAELGIER